MIITDDDRTLSIFYAADVQRLRRSQEDTIIARAKYRITVARREAARREVTDNTVGGLK